MRSPTPRTTSSTLTPLTRDAVGAAEVRQDERALAGLDASVIARHAAIAEHDRVVAGATDRHRPMLHGQEAMLPIRTDLAQDDARRIDGGDLEDHRLGRLERHNGSRVRLSKASTAPADPAARLCHGFDWSIDGRFRRAIDRAVGERCVDAGIAVGDPAIRHESHGRPVRNNEAVDPRELQRGLAKLNLEVRAEVSERREIAGR